MLNNPLFCSILVGTSVLQVLIVEFGSVAFAVADNGLEGRFWAVSLILGAGSLPVQQVINVIYRMGQSAKASRNRRRLATAGAMTKKKTN